jgi:hypothetical protein
LKQASDASRVKAPVVNGTPLANEDICAIILFWESRHPEYFRSEFNATNMKNCLFAQIATGNMTFGIEALDKCFAWLDANGYLEKQFTTPRPRGEFVNSGAPKVYPVFTTPAEREGQAQEAQDAALTDHLRVVEAALRLPFAELQKHVRATNPNYASKVVTL